MPVRLWESCHRRDKAPNGSTKSCGCILVEKNRSRPVREQRNVSHGEGGNKKSPRSPEYQSWASMLQRCRDAQHSNFKNYGGRSISVCERWATSYEAFLSDMGRRPSLAHSLDRFPDVNGNYEPSNCRWAPISEQLTNKRNTRFAFVEGVRQAASVTARTTGIPERTILNWLKKVAPSEDITELVRDRKASAKPLSTSIDRS